MCSQYECFENLYLSFVRALAHQAGCPQHCCLPSVVVGIPGAHCTEEEAEADRAGNLCAPHHTALSLKFKRIRRQSRVSPASQNQSGSKPSDSPSEVSDGVLTSGVADVPGPLSAPDLDSPMILKSPEYIPSGRHASLLSFRITSLFSETGCHSVTEAGVQWCNHGPLQCQTPGFKQSSHLSLLSGWDYRCSPPFLANFWERIHEGGKGRVLHLAHYRKGQWSLRERGATRREQDRVSLCHSGWSAMAQSRLTATSASQVQAILVPQPPKLNNWDYRPMPPCLANFLEMGFHHFGQAGLEFLALSDLAALPCQSVSHCVWPLDTLYSIDTFSLFSRLPEVTENGLVKLCPVTGPGEVPGLTPRGWSHEPRAGMPWAWQGHVRLYPHARQESPRALLVSGAGWGTRSTSGILGQHGVEATEWRELQGKAERVDADADERHDARVLQRMQHAGLLPELREVLHGICGPQVPQHGVCRGQHIVSQQEDPGCIQPRDSRRRHRA
ncbi:UPF0764 protein C16orf89 [Plecturocebus cupreus]